MFAFGSILAVLRYAIFQHSIPEKATKKSVHVSVQDKCWLIQMVNRECQKILVPRDVNENFTQRNNVELSFCKY